MPREYMYIVPATAASWLSFSRGHEGTGHLTGTEARKRTGHNDIFERPCLAVIIPNYSTLQMNAWFSSHSKYVNASLSAVVFSRMGSLSLIVCLFFNN